MCSETCLQGHLYAVKPVFKGHLNTVKPVFRGHLYTVKSVFEGHLCCKTYLQALLYRGCPLIGVSLEDRLYCIDGVLSSECPLKTLFDCRSGEVADDYDIVDLRRGEYLRILGAMRG